MKAKRAGGAAILSFTAMVGLVFAMAGFAGEGPAKQPSNKKAKTYIVQMRNMPLVAYEGGIAGLKATKPEPGQRLNRESPEFKKYAAHLQALHDAALASVGGRKVYDYHVVFDGFAAVLTEGQAQALESHPDVVRVWEDVKMRPQTNSTPQFLGLTGGGKPWSKGWVGEDVVIGVIDTGIQPDHPSLADVKTPKKGDKGAKIAYGPPPAGWTGTGCEFGNTAFNPDDAPFTCNNKLLKAEAFSEAFDASEEFAEGEFLSARDSDGHGTHTATTSGGNFGVEAEIDDEPVGIVSGIAPRARIAVYKVCWEAPDPDDSGCFSSDSMAAINQAVADGVDVINFSIGGPGTSFTGADDIAFLFAADAGVFVSVSAGNDGPGAQTIGTPSGIPWVTAVGATEDNENFGTGLQVTAPVSIAATYEGLEGAGPVTLEDSGTISAQVVPAAPLNGCNALTNGAAVNGQIALVIRGTCNFDVKYNNAAAAGARAIVVYNDGTAPDRFDPITMSAPGTTIPGIMIGFEDGNLINTTAANETVTGTLSPDIKVPRVDRITGFSSRGPNGGAPDIIKPDVAAPGVGIIAGETLFPNANAGGGQLFQFLSGTSMASPHVAGTFALLKQAHPDWTPAIARSALMTTARQNLRKTFGPEAADPFDIGAGFIRPANAFEPGLAYDAGLLDYLAFLCGAENQNGAGVVGPVLCNQLEGAGFSLDSSDLNLPSIGVADLVGTQTVTRRVTNVSKRPVRYFAVVDQPAGVDVKVVPSGIVLRPGETKSFEITFTVNDNAVPNEWVFGSLTWRGQGGPEVRSPIAVRPVPIDAPDEVRAEGAPGEVSFDVTFGYNGDYAVEVDGLVGGLVQSDTVADGDFNQHNFVVPAGTTLARFATYDDDVGGGDLDMQVFFNTGNGFQLVGSSGGPTAEEAVTLVNPQPGTYAVLVIDFATPAGPTAYSVFDFNLDGSDKGNATVTAPATAVLGEPGTVTVEWGALDPGTRYLGILNHTDGTETLGQTEILINNQ